LKKKKKKKKKAKICFKTPERKGNSFSETSLKENFRPLYGHPSIHPSIHPSYWMYYHHWLLLAFFCWDGGERLQTNVVLIWSHILKKIIRSVTCQQQQGGYN